VRALLTGEDPALADIRVTSRIVSDHLTATYFEARMRGPLSVRSGRIRLRKTFTSPYTW